MPGMVGWQPSRHERLDRGTGHAKASSIEAPPPVGKHIGDYLSYPLSIAGVEPLFRPANLPELFAHGVEDVVLYLRIRAGWVRC